MNDFEFGTNEKAAAFCAAIAAEMTRLFGISRGEAVGRINAHWKDQPMLDDQDMVYHETEEFWARQIYFEDEPRWWQIPDPRPRRYP